MIEDERCQRVRQALDVLIVLLAKVFAPWNGSLVDAELSQVSKPHTRQRFYRKACMTSENSV